MRAKALGAYLEGLFDRYHRLECLAPDPLSFLHRYEHREDIEVVGLIAAALAFGRVEQIHSSVERVLLLLGPRPAEGARRFDGRSAGSRLRGFAHRWSRAEDMAALLASVRRTLDRHGSLEALFALGYVRGHPQAIRSALTEFVRGLRTEIPGGAGDRRGVRFLLCDPAGGSACKRLNLFLRWMVRREDPLDRGVWSSVSPADLIVPLDTHVARLAREIGLSRRRTADWKMAEEVTAALRLYDPSDPTRFDFALCRSGMVESREAGRRPRRKSAAPARRLKERRTRAGGTSR